MELLQSLSEVTIQCLSCGHSSVMDAKQFKEIAGELSIESLACCVQDFKCTNCQQKLVKITSPSNTLLFDGANLSFCSECGTVISAARISAVPNTTRCMECQNNDEKPKRTPLYPQVPVHQRLCPRCNSRTEVRQNREDLNYFIGCSAYPKCRFTVELREQP